jgi:opacity protein-like surface antigen
LKRTLLFVLILAFAGMAFAQGPMSNLSISVGGEGIFPAATFNAKAAETSAGYIGLTQANTKSIGATGEARYDFGRHSAVGVSFTANRSSEIFENSDFQSIARVQSNNFEILGNYIFRLPSNERIKPYAMFGGGVIRFSPVTGYTTGSTPQSSSKIGVDYGFGSDFPVTDHWSLRLQYRGLLRADPDFKLYVAPSGISGGNSSGFGTSLKTHVVEPSIQIVYHF